MTLGVCKHYCGLMCGQCNAGVHYEKFFGEGPGVVQRLACFARNDGSVRPCEKRELPTEEEVARYTAWSHERSRMLDEAYRRCADHAQQKEFKLGGDSVSGSVVCPQCGGVLKYSIAGSNGHIWAKCKRRGCMRWMQ